MRREICHKRARTVKRVVVVDYGCGNILSVARAFEHLGYIVDVSATPDKVKTASRIILPGVGAFPAGIRNLNHLGLKDALLEAGANGTPILGICLGMQLLFTTGYEYYEVGGLGLLEGHVRKMASKGEATSELTLPEVGWRRLERAHLAGSFNNSIFKSSFGHSFYFVHSYEATPINSEEIVAEYKRGDRSVVAAVVSNNIIGVQFHPEKSGPNGLGFLCQFVSFLND